MIITFLFSLCCSKVSAQANSVTLKLGTYDSRVVTLAFSRSELFKKVAESFSDPEGIMQSNDSAKMAVFFCKIFTKQYILHQQVFSRGTTANVLDLLKDQLPQLAKDEGVSAIVSKWELTFVSPDIEVIDLTMPLSRLFKPTGDFDQMVTEIQKVDPIPLEELTVEEVVQAWQQFEKKYFAKK